MNYINQIKKHGFVIFKPFKVFGPLGEPVKRNGKIVGYVASHTLHGIYREGIVSVQRLLRA